MLNLKKLLKYLLLAAVVSIGYQFVTGESITSVPGKIRDFFYQPEVRDKSANVYHSTKMEEELSKQTK